MPLIAALASLTVSVVLALTPAISMPGGSGQEPLFPAPPGYVLPWAGGEIHSVTQGEDTSFTHNGAAAYGVDFDLSYDTVVAARSGKVAMVRDDSNSGGCSAYYSASANYVVIDHGDGMASLYLHLAYDSVQVQVGQEVRRGEAIGVSGETGVTCSGETGLDPGPHLHFQVQPYVEGKYFTQSQPIAFDDIPTDNGVAREGNSYVSGNYAPGKPQKIKLTPYRVSRQFNPQAVPLYPDLVQAEDLGPTPEPSLEPDTPTPTKTPVPLAELYTTPEVQATDTPTPEPPLEAPTEETVPTPHAPPPTATPTDVVVPTPIAPSATPVVIPTDTPEPDPTPEG